MFLGDSLTAGYGLSEGEGYPSHIESLLEKDNIPWRVVNAGVSGDTTSGGLRRLAWVLKSKPDAVFLALGANDGLRGIDPKLTKKNLEKMIKVIKSSGSLVLLAGMEIPTNYGEDYNKAFRDIYPALAKKEKLLFFPFLLEGVAMKRSLNLADGIHPNEKGQKIIGENIYQFLKRVLWKKKS